MTTAFISHLHGQFPIRQRVYRRGCRSHVAGARRNPAAGALLDSLEADHLVISPAAAALGAAGRRYAAMSADEPRADLVAALDALTSVLFPHLDREVEEAMPVVSACITQAEWHAVESEYNIKPKSLAQLGIEGHEREQRRRINVEQGAALVAGRAVTAEEVDGLWALVAVEVYQMLTELRGWTPQQYESWLADVIERLLPGPDQRG
jgi:hypothetical protein